jgi:hypothetical protein
MAKEKTALRSLVSTMDAGKESGLLRRNRVPFPEVLLKVAVPARFGDLP